jgi:hypothetical protein
LGFPSLFKIEVIIEIEKDPTRLQQFPTTLVRSSIFLHQIKSIKILKAITYPDRKTVKYSIRIEYYSIPEFIEILQKN